MLASNAPYTIPNVELLALRCWRRISAFHSMMTINATWVWESEPACFSQHPRLGVSAGIVRPVIRVIREGISGCQYPTYCPRQQDGQNHLKGKAITFSQFTQLRLHIVLIEVIQARLTKILTGKSLNTG